MRFCPVTVRYNAVRRCRCRLRRCICARARFLIYARGGQGIERCLGGGGVTSTYNSNKNVVVNLLLYRRDFGSMNMCIYVSAYQAVGAGIRGQRWGEWAQKSPKNFLVKTLDIGSNRVYTGCRKRRKSLPHELGVNINLVLCIVNTMYIESVAYVFGGEQCSFFICGSKHTTP